MNYDKIDRQLSPRTQRFMRELAGPARQENDDVRFWRSVSALVCIAVVCCFITLLGFVTGCTSLARESAAGDDATAGCTALAGQYAAGDDVIYGEYAGFPRAEENEAPGP